MSRSGYSDDCENLAMWRGMVASAVRGKRGQQFFRDLIAALDAMPDKKLIKNSLEVQSGEVCALGALGRAKGVDMQNIDTEDYGRLGTIFNIAECLAQEVMFENDEIGWNQEPIVRWTRMRAWAQRNLKDVQP